MSLQEAPKAFHEFEIDDQKFCVYKFKIEPGLVILQRLQSYFGEAIGGIVSGLSVGGGTALLDADIKFDGDGLQRGLLNLSSRLAQEETLDLVKEIVKQSNMTCTGVNVSETFDATLQKFDDPYGALLQATFEAVRFNYANFFKRFGVTSESLRTLIANVMSDESASNESSNEPTPNREAAPSSAAS